MQLSIFCDFDDTITMQDVGNAMFQTFGDYHKYWNEYINGKYSCRELNIKLCNSIPAAITKEIITNFALSQEVDAYFVNFVNYCHSNNYNFTIVSDGYDIYINPIINSLNLKNGIKIFCNKMQYIDNKFIPDFFGSVESCTCSTASCKRNVVLNNSADDDILVYIGDGMTDFCAAEHCDIVFAKKQLAHYCNENKIPHYPFRSFFDIQRILEQLVKTKKIKKRNQAHIKRKNAFEAE